jgi:putative endonuclease
MGLTRLELGKIGEEKTCAYFTSLGYKVIERNFRTKIGEIDIIAEIDKLLVFVEVKTRTSLSYGAGYESVRVIKQKKIRSIALQFMNLSGLYYRAVRFDVVSLLLSKEGEIIDLKHFESAF